MYGNDIKQVREIKYLCVLLDHQLNFSLLVDYAIAKAKRSAAKFVLSLTVETGFLYG